jgi:hypothetical protein
MPEDRLQDLKAGFRNAEMGKIERRAKGIAHSGMTVNGIGGGVWEINDWDRERGA